MSSARHDVIVLSLSSIASDGRILRQIASFLDAGYHVSAISPFAGERGTGSRFSHPCLTYVDLPPVLFSQYAKARVFLAFLAARLIGPKRSARWATRQYPGAAALQHATLRYLDRHCPSNGPTAPPFLVAHDWTSLGSALAALRRYGVRFHYDCHEVSISEHASHPLWQLVFPPIIAEIEAAGMRNATSASTVGSMILRDMTTRYAPASPMLLIRNIPDGIPQPPRPTGARIEVLFHGLFKADRQVVELVRDVVSWPEPFVLRLRGHAPDGAYARLIADAAAPLGERVQFEALAPLEAIQARTAASDIGVCLHDTGQAANRIALPNKLFEYLHSGLMVLVPEQTEMAALVAPNGAGIGVRVVPLQLAPILATLDRARIDRHKANAFALAQTLTWDNEIAPLLQVLKRPYPHDKIPSRPG